MPDWSYHPLLMPVTEWLPGSARRTLALRGLQAVVSIPGGWLIPDLLGDMAPAPDLAGVYRRVRLATPVGLGGGLDPDAIAIGGLGRFGFGFVEVGPYVLTDAPLGDFLPAPLVIAGEPEQLDARLRRRPNGLAVWLRLVIPTDTRAAIGRLAPVLDHVRGQIDAVCVSFMHSGEEGDDRDGWSAVVMACAERGIQVLLADASAGEPLSGLDAALAAGVAGVVIRHPLAGSGWNDCLKAIKDVRTLASDHLVVAGCGARSPRQVLETADAGADLVVLDTGVVDAGPGLAKRTNEALAGRIQHSTNTSVAAWKQGWLWSLLLGAGMVVGGAAVLAVGMTRVVLPYDEAFLGATREQFSHINPRLLAFMQHDRITLAATLLSIGILYGGLAWGGMRRGQRWARRALLASGVIGFASLFLFLGFHYIDPLHVALSTGLFPLFIVGMLLPLRHQSYPSRDLDNDAAWRLGLVGQLLLVGLGAGLVMAGLTITTVGVTRVFVFSDLQFLQSTAALLSGANPHLLPLIAHDRAGFGGALASDGMALLLLALWGFRRGESWVWWTLLWSGLIGFLGGLYAHLAVGYLEVWHLLPLLASGAVFSLGLVLAYPYLARIRA